MRLKAGETIGYTVTWLEMTARPAYARPSLPLGVQAALIGATRPPVDYFLYLYAAVGADYEWTDQFKVPRPDLAAFVQDPDVGLWTLLVDGWPGGFYMLDRRAAGTCDLAYFGLVPEAIGRGLGTWLLRTAVHAGWDMPGTVRMTVNTCSLDHPAALSLYQKAGFSPMRQEQRSRILARDRIIRD
jgi:GNAT superfamily N-acetyltransferase